MFWGKGVLPSVIASGKIARLSFRAWTQPKHVTLVCHDIKKVNSAVSSLRWVFRLLHFFRQHFLFSKLTKELER